MKPLISALSALALLAPAGSFAEPQADPGLIQEITNAVSPEALRQSIETLVGFGTRHTMSDTTSETRGIGAARRWAENQFAAFSVDCGGCLTIAKPSAVISGERRIPTPTLVENVLAIKRGATDPDRVIIISGHIDSINSDVMDFEGDAPGANDDGSGTAAVIEAARVLSRYDFPATLVFAVLSGEEQGLYGGQILADYAAEQGWKVEAVLNNDIVGNSEGSSGEVNTTTVRVFAEGVRANETPQQAATRRSTGGEVDSPSRNLARYLDRLADQVLLNFDVMMIYRTDRFGRGGDQVRMLEAGYPAVRLTEMLENFERQHQNVRVEDGIQYGDLPHGVDYEYLANVTKLNVAAMASLAEAPPPPSLVRVSGGVTPNTRVSWTEVGEAAGYFVWWRATTSAQWERSRWVPQGETSLTLPGVIIDNAFFGVSAVSPNGYESPVQFPGSIGAFIPAEAPQ